MSNFKFIVLYVQNILIKGLPGNLWADNLEGIITKVFIIFFNYEHNINRGKIVHQNI